VGWEEFLGLRNPQDGTYTRTMIRSVAQDQPSIRLRR